MHVTQLEWIVTLGVTIAVLLFDVIVIGRRPHEPTKRETATYLTVYVALAVMFGLWVWFFHGSQFGLEFFAGWLTEYSLSVDNLFIFLIIMASFNVPKVYQQQALLVGIILALVFRGIFIALGAVPSTSSRGCSTSSAHSSSTPPSIWSAIPTTTTTRRTSWSGSRAGICNSPTGGRACGCGSRTTASG